ncbi:Repeat domain-containing protein [Candidatus Electrothrix aarhusensis]|uniref:Repeat domain-containing protein n=1 Tax=Candidatus Electrothrix aarhusensis TaxID=1859131 RepID=A0A444IPT8_9BACT|nr:Repeat domain-containing protein [Candidatus Electrothrix aarhusensis]
MVMLLILLMYGQAYASTGQDFFVSVEDGGTALYYYPVTDPNTFGQRVLIDDTLEGVGGEKIELADFNNDGRSDILLMGGSNTYIYYQGANIKFVKTDIIYDLVLDDFGGLSPEAGDFNNDGLQDFIYVDKMPLTEKIFIALNNGNGSFSGYVLDTVGPIWGYTVSSGDFNEDGNLDILEQPYPTGGTIVDAPIYLRAGNGDGTFAGRTDVFHANYLIGTKPLIADFDNDNHLDVIVGGDDDGDPGQAFLFRGNGDGTFTSAGEAYDSSLLEWGGDQWNHTSNNAYDFDRDGDKDVLLIGQDLDSVPNGNLVLIMENQGDGTFVGPLSVPDLSTGLVSFVGPGSNAVESINILSDGTWKSYDSLQPGWEAADFDDSNWRNAYAPYPNYSQPTDLISETNAVFMWDYPAADIPSGTNGPDEAFFRKTFNISVDPSNIINATVSVVADDDFDFYVNGIHVYEDWDGIIGFPNVPYVIDIKPYLVQGKNVLAMYASDSYGIYEWALVDATIEFDFPKKVPVKTTGKIKTYNWKSDIDRAEFSMKGVKDIDTAAKYAEEYGAPVTFHFGAPGEEPIYSFSAADGDFLNVQKNKMYFRTPSDDLRVTCRFQKEICSVRIRHSNFDGDVLDALLTGDMTVTLGVGDTKYTETGEWKQYNSRSGKLTEYKK